VVIGLYTGEDIPTDELNQVNGTSSPPSTNPYSRKKSVLLENVIFFDESRIAKGREIGQKFVDMLVKGGSDSHWKDQIQAESERKVPYFPLLI
jgi:hypothetical protein